MRGKGTEDEGWKSLKSGKDENQEMMTVWKEVDVKVEESRGQNGRK